jgi:hypothetical protein
MSALAQDAFNAITQRANVSSDAISVDREHCRLLIEHTGKYNREVADRSMFELSQLYRSCCAALLGDDEDIRKKLKFSKDELCFTEDKFCFTEQDLLYTVARFKYTVYNLICANASLLVIEYLKKECESAEPQITLELTPDGLGWILECESCVYYFNLYRVYDEENTMYSWKYFERISRAVIGSKYPTSVKLWTHNQLIHLLSD